MNDQDETHDWVDAVKARGFGGILRVTLDAFEPLGALGAQLLYVAQPLSGVFGWRETVGKIAQSLEEPGGIDAIRRRLDSDD